MTPVTDIKDWAALEPLRVLHLEDNPRDQEIIRMMLENSEGPCQLVQVRTRAEFEAALEQGQFDVILSDYTLPSFDGLAALALARARRPEIPYLFVSGTIGEERAVESLKHGATDYVHKGHLERLVPAVHRARQEARERIARQRAEEALVQQARLATLGAEVGVALIQTGSVREVLRHCTEAIVTHLDAAFARVWTLNEAENVLELQASAGMYTHLDGAHGRVPVGQLKIGLIAHERKPHLTNSVVGDPRVNNQAWAKREGMVAFAGYPLLVEDRLVGVIAMFARHPLSEATLTALGSVADSIALGIERKRTEEALRRAEANFRSIFENAVEGICQSTPAGRYLAVNPAMARIFGYAAPEDMIREVTDITRQIYVEPEHRREFLRRLKEGGTTKFENTARRKDGTIIWISQSARPVTDAQGRVLYYEGSVADITERKHAEQSLAGERNLLRTLIDNLPAHIFVKDAAGRYLISNESHTRLVGAGAESDLLGKTVFDYFPPELARAFDQDDQEVLRTGNPVVQREEACEEQGQCRWYSLTKVPFRDAQGKIVGLVGVKHDITERKRAELRLKAFSNLGQELNSAKAAIEAGDIIMKVADQLFGWDACTLDLYSTQKDRMSHVLNRDTVNGQRVSVPPLYDGVAPSPRARRVIERGAQLILQEGPDTPSDGIPFGDTARRSASVMVVPIRDGAKVIGVLSIQSYQIKAYSPQDLDALQSLAEHCGGALKRIQTTEGLRESERLLRQVMDLVPHFIFAKDVDGHYLLANRACAEANGVTPEQMVGRSDLDLLPDRAQAERLMQDDRQVIAGAKSNLLLEEQFTDAAGRTRILQTVKMRFAAPGTGKPSVLGVSVDITDKKQIEAQMLHAQRLESIGTLASGVAHDLNNILAPIQMAAQLLEMGPLDEGERKMVATIATSAKRGADIVKQVLTFARNTPGRRAPVQPKHIVREISNIISETFPKNIYAQLNIAANLPVILGDATQLHQVLLNLCVNARDAMPRGGTLTLKAETLDVDESFAAMNPGTKPGQHILLTVQDTGMGILQTILDRIFDPFFTTKEQGKGTGLGLSTALGIVQGHGGFIRVQSELGHGTIFQVYLPVVAGQEVMAQEAVSAKGPEGRGELVLVVDDEARILEMTRQLLTRSGYQVALASDGAEAVAIFAAAMPDIKLVLTDMMMPNMDGPMLIRALKKINPLIPVIASSGLGSSSLSPDATSPDGPAQPEALGAAAFLAKPYSAHDLLTTIRRLLDEAEAEAHRTT